MQNYYIAPKNKALFITSIVGTIGAVISVIPVLFMLTLGTAFASAADAAAQVLYLLIFVCGAYMYVFIGLLWYFYAVGVPSKSKNRFILAIGLLVVPITFLVLWPYLY